MTTTIKTTRVYNDFDVMIGDNDDDDDASPYPVFEQIISDHILHNISWYYDIMGDNYNNL